MATMSAAAGTPSPEEQARAAWAAIDKPVTEESFVAWYCKTHANKTEGSSDAEPPRPRRRQALLPGAAAPSAAGLAKGKRQALLKAVGASLKAAVKGKEDEVAQGRTRRRCRARRSARRGRVQAALPGRHDGDEGRDDELRARGRRARGGLWRPEDLRADVEPHAPLVPEGAQDGLRGGVSVASAEGKYSTGTSTLTIKFCLRVAGGCGDYGGFGGFGGFGPADLAL